MLWGWWAAALLAHTIPFWRIFGFSVVSPGCWSGAQPSELGWEMFTGFAHLTDGGFCSWKGWCQFARVLTS